MKEGNISLWSFKLFPSLGVSEEYKLNVCFGLSQFIFFPFRKNKQKPTTLGRHEFCHLNKTLTKTTARVGVEPCWKNTWNLASGEAGFGNRRSKVGEDE